MPTIREEIQNLGPVERRRRKALRLAETAAARLPITWRLGAGARAVDITVSAASFDGEALRLRVGAVDRTGRTIRTDEVVIVNPPIMTPTGQQVPNPDPEGPAMINEYREDAIGAIRSVVEDVVRMWQGGEA